MRVIVLSLALEEVEDVLHGELADGFAAFDSRLGEFTLRFLQLKDALFDAVVDREAVDGHVDGLVEAVDTVDCLFFDELVDVSYNIFERVVQENVPGSRRAP